MARAGTTTAAGTGISAPGTRGPGYRAGLRFGVRVGGAIGRAQCHAFVTQSPFFCDNPGPCLSVGRVAASEQTYRAVGRAHPAAPSSRRLLASRDCPPGSFCPAVFLREILTLPSHGRHAAVTRCGHSVICKRLKRKPDWTTASSRGSESSSSGCCCGGSMKRRNPKRTLCLCGRLMKRHSWPA